jgi:hypothetical protein
MSTKSGVIVLTSVSHIFNLLILVEIISSIMNHNRDKKEDKQNIRLLTKTGMLNGGEATAIF